MMHPISSLEEAFRLPAPRVLQTLKTPSDAEVSSGWGFSVLTSDNCGGSDDGDDGGGNDVGDPVQPSQQPAPMLAMRMNQ